MFEDNKSRRNLMVMSSFVVATYLLNLKITLLNTTTIFWGTSLQSSVDNSNRIYWLMFFVQIYLLMRFWISAELEKDKYNVYNEIMKWAGKIVDRSNDICFKRSPKESLKAKNSFWTFYLNRRCWKTNLYSEIVEKYNGINPIWLFLKNYWQIAIGHSKFEPHVAAVLLIYAFKDGVASFFKIWSAHTTNITVPIALASWAIGIELTASIKTRNTNAFDLIDTNEALLLAILVAIGVSTAYFRIVFFPTRIKPKLKNYAE